jgi:hypothetical protein
MSGDILAESGGEDIASRPFRSLGEPFRFFKYVVGNGYRGFHTRSITGGRAPVHGAALCLLWIASVWKGYLSRQTTWRQRRCRSAKRKSSPGENSYILKIKNISKSNVVLRFSFDGVVEPEFVQMLDDNGEARIDVASNVRKGSYRFMAYRKEDETTWHNIDVTVAVT